MTGVSIAVSQACQTGLIDLLSFGQHFDVLKLLTDYVESSIHVRVLKKNMMTENVSQQFPALVQLQLFCGDKCVTTAP